MRQRSARKLFASTVLVLEAFLVLFAGLVAYGLRLAEPVAVAAVAGAVAAVALAAAGLLRYQAGYVLGWAVQAWLVLSGLLIPAMFVLGGVFAALWVVGLRLGTRIDRERTERAAGG